MNLPTLNDVTQGHVSMLLSTANVLTQVLFHGPPPYTGATPDRPDLDGGVKCAVETTLINVCAKLDEIISEKKRWGTEELDGLEEQLMKTLVADENTMNTQSAVLKKAMLPHVIMKTAVGQEKSSGRWICIAPDSMLIANPLAGQGRTPEEACADFDRKFYERETQNPEVDSPRGGAPEPSPKLESRPGMHQSAEPIGEGDSPEDGKPARRKPAARKFTRPRRRKPKPGDDADATANV